MSPGCHLLMIEWILAAAAALSNRSVHPCVDACSSMQAAASNCGPSVKIVDAWDTGQWAARAVHSE